MSGSSYLSDIHAIILEQGLGKARSQILRKQLEGKGGTSEQTLSESITHILIGNNVRLSRLPQLLKVKSVPEDVTVLRADWLSACLVKGKRVDHVPYVVKQEDTTPSSDHSSLKTSPVKKAGTVSPVKGGLDSQAATITNKEEAEEPGPSSSDKGNVSPPQKGIFPNSSRRWKVSPKKSKWDNLDSDSDYVDSGDEDSGLEEPEDEAPPTTSGDEENAEAAPPPKKKRRWICEFASTEAQSWVNHNKHITDKLEELVVVYQNNGDKWRAMSTRKVIQAIKKHPKEITSHEEARNIPFVGERLANKILEIIVSGGLRRLEHVDQEKEQIIKMFTNIHGVGQITAQQFYAQGYRTLEDLVQSGILNRQQQIGIRHYHEFIERMSREEVKEIEDKVREVAHSINSGLEVVTCGSYRRGKLTCGDVDILITHPDGRSHKGVFMSLIQKCTEIGFFTDDLSIHNDPVGQSKYLGVCILPGEGRKHRRIDIFVVPYSQFPCALVHFTGSGHYNRSMRSKADKLKGVKIFNGTPLPVFCEEDIFKYLDIPYREPKDRDYD